MSQITTHILDTTRGKPATGIVITLYRQQDDQWKEMAAGVTNTDGRIPGLLPKDTILAPGVYKMLFETKPYFDKLAIATFYPYVEIAFAITDNTHYHIPLLLNPFGYTTYRGS